MQEITSNLIVIEVKILKNEYIQNFNNMIKSFYIFISLLFFNNHNFIVLLITFK